MQLKLILGAALALAATAPAAAVTTLLNVTNQNNSTSYNFAVTANSASTAVSFAGYNLPAFIQVSQIDFYASGDPTTNLLAPTFTFTPAPAGSDAYTNSNGSAPDTLYFGAVVVNSYDTYSQNVATTAGTSYHLSFNYANGSSPSGLIVSTSAGNVPEPATWAMMIGGLAMTGVALRRRKAAVAA